MNTKQQWVLGASVLLLSIVLVIAIINVVPFGLPVEPVTEIPEAPTLNDIDSLNTDGSVEISWTFPDQARWIHLERSEGTDDFYLLFSTVFSVSYVDRDVSDGTYRYRVRAYNSLGSSPFSNVESVVVLIPVPPLEIPNSPVLRLMVNSPSTDGEISLKWDIVSNADDYAVYRTKEGDSIELLEEAIDENHYDDLVTESGDYSYIVKAGNDAGISDPSNEVSVTVQIPGIPEKPFMNELDYEIIEYTIIIYLDWDEVNCDSYNVYRSVNYSDYEPLEEGLTSTSYSEVLTEVGMYMYKVSAVNTYGESDLSIYVSIEITDDGEPPVEPSLDYIVVIVVILVLGALVGATIILVKKKKRKR